ncbi:unnamed protein product [Cylicocyclus nassatus]|uniref:Uncharacterized protein n=1 Tax=Cylicocyclus nassatus TaxID=53992 RepID=A0AA36H591_CYLNA|nr:unnamed protein product [Cylicocyclus nassatus]
MSAVSVIGVKFISKEELARPKKIIYCMLRLRPSRVQLLLRHYSAKLENPAEPKFSQSAAFQGRRRGAGVPPTPFKLDYYDSDEFSKKKLLSIAGSLAAFILYFGYLRKPSDLDEIWNTPPHILTANLERKMLRDQIREAEAKGQDTALLKAQLDYVDVKEEALRIQFGNKEKKKKAS